MTPLTQGLFPNAAWHRVVFGGSVVSGDPTAASRDSATVPFQSFSGPFDSPCFEPVSLEGIPR